MKMKQILLFFHIFFILVHSGKTEAQLRIEFSLALSLNYPLLDTSYTHRFRAPFQPGDYSSSAAQTLNLKAQKGTGLSATLNVFPWPNIGFQILVNSFKSSIEGDNPPYAVLLRYIARQPPDYVPHQYTYERSMDWPPTEGNFEQISLSLNGIASFALAKNIQMGFSAGLSYQNFKGKAESLGYSKFWLGGHSVLFGEEYRLRFDFGPQAKIGFDLGGELDVGLSKNFGLILDGRYFLFPKVSVDIKLDLVENTGYVRPIDLAEERIPTDLLSINASLLRINLGLKYKF